MSRDRALEGGRLASFRVAHIRLAAEIVPGWRLWFLCGTVVGRPNKEVALFSDSAGDRGSFELAILRESGPPT